MKYLIYIAVLGYFLSLANDLKAQSQQGVIQGIVRDQQTLEPVPSVHVVTTQRGTFSSSEGLFSMEVAETDTIRFSHINYQPHSIAASIVDDTLMVFLLPRNRLLQEVMVRGLPTEEQFNSELLGLNLSPSQEEVHARINTAHAQALFRSGYVPIMNSQDNYFWHQQEPQGITLFSSGPTKGLAKAIKHLLRSQRPLALQPNYSVLPVAGANPVKMIEPKP